MCQNNNLWISDSNHSLFTAVPDAQTQCSSISTYGCRGVGFLVKGLELQYTY